MIALILAVSTVLVVSFLCSLSEATLLSTTHSQVAEMLQHHRGLGRIWLRFKEKIENPIAVILIINTIANTAGAVVAGSAFEKNYGTQYFVVFSIIFTTAVLFLSEILPKTLGVRYRRFIAPGLALPLNLLLKAFKPLMVLTGNFSKLFYGKLADSGQPQIANEIQSLTALARISGNISHYEESLIKESFDLMNMTAGQVMIPAADLAIFSTTMTIQEALSIAQIAGHSRYPLIEGEDRNNILGYVSFKELSIATDKNETVSLQDISRPILTVEASLPASKLLKYFVESHEHIAVVKSRETTILGMVTFEDILEEIVGEVKDEYQRLPREAMAIDKDRWIVGGGMRLDEMRKELAIDNPAIENSTQQLAAWLIEKLGHSPGYNDRVALGGFEFQVKRMRRGKASEIKVTRI